MFVVPPFSKQTIKIDVIIVLLNFEIIIIVEFQEKIFRLQTYLLTWSFWVVEIIFFKDIMNLNQKKRMSKKLFSTKNCVFNLITYIMS